MGYFFATSSFIHCASFTTFMATFCTFRQLVLGYLPHLPTAFSQSGVTMLNRGMRCAIRHNLQTKIPIRTMVMYRENSRSKCNVNRRNVTRRHCQTH